MNHKLSKTFSPGIGPTRELSLRVSVATLARVLFEHPRDGELMLALERRATLRQTENDHFIEVKSQPFGGAIRIHDLGKLRDLIGDFHFDSEQSQAEQDFRIFIRPSDWLAVRELCIEYISRDGNPILETDPARELTEEFGDALKFNLKPDQYDYEPVATVVEDDLELSENVQATARIYHIFEVRILDSSLVDTIMANSESISDEDLCELAFDDAGKGGKGRANAVLALSLNHLTDAYLGMSPDERNAPILFMEHQLDETVAAVLENITVPKYRRS